jgi:membrane-associated phospholipid phosphatase
VTVLRKAINAPRPYECLGIPAISPKDTVGKSFPSRHAACVGVIAVTTLYEVPAWGVALLVIGVLIAASRVLAGVHFLRDVVCGLLLGGIIGYVGMYLIP